MKISSNYVSVTLL